MVSFFFFTWMWSSRRGAVLMRMLVWRRCAAAGFAGRRASAAWSAVFVRGRVGRRVGGTLERARGGDNLDRMGWDGMGWTGWIWRIGLDWLGWDGFRCVALRRGTPVDRGREHAHVASWQIASEWNRRRDFRSSHVPPTRNGLRVSQAPHVAPPCVEQT